MTKNYKKWGILAGTSIGAILLVSVLSLGVFNSQAEAEVHRLPGPGSICSFEGQTPQHWDKIVFTSKKNILGSDGSVVAKKGSIMDIKVIDDPNRIEFPMQKAADKLNSVGWTTDKGNPFTPNDLKLIDIEYAIVCAFSDFGRLPPGWVP